MEEELFRELLVDAFMFAWIAIKRKYPHIAERGRPKIWLAVGEFARQMDKEGKRACAYPTEWAIAIKMPYWKDFWNLYPDWCFRNLTRLLIHEFLHLAKPEASEEEVEKESDKIFREESEKPLFRRLYKKWYEVTRKKGFIA